MSSFDNFTIMCYKTESNGSVTFSPFVLDTKINKDATSIHGINNTSTHKAIDTKNDTPTTTNDTRNESANTAESSYSKPKPKHSSNTNNTIISNITENTIKLARYLLHVYKNHFVVNKLKYLITLLKLKNFRFKIRLDKNQIYLLFSNHSLNLIILAKIMLGQDKLFEFYMGKNKAFKEFVQMFNKRELKKLSLIRKK